MTIPTIALPYLLFIGSASDPLTAKTAIGVRHWRPEACVGQMRLPGCTVDLDLPDLDLHQGLERGARTLLVGVANRGGRTDPAWVALLQEALELGYDLASGLHERLAAIPELARAAEANGRTIHDVRHPRSEFAIATGLRRPGKRLLTVGTDCSVGKMFTALSVAAEMKRRGCNVDFRATGQTGILIAGSGVSVDAVVSDFVAGAVEALCPANDPDHWDVVEGQASVLHPSYAGVTTALVHGSQPDAMILCHEPRRPHMRGLPHFAVPGLAETIAAHEAAARVTNRTARIVAVSLNSHHLDEAAARAEIARATAETGLPATDPVRFGPVILADAVLAQDGPMTSA